MRWKLGEELGEEQVKKELRDCIWGKEDKPMLWREIDLSTFDVPTLEGWIADLLDEIATIQREIDSRGLEPTGPADLELTDPATGGYPPTDGP